MTGDEYMDYDSDDGDVGHLGRIVHDVDPYAGLMSPRCSCALTEAVQEYFFPRIDARKS